MSKEKNTNLSDIEIAQKHKMSHIKDIAAKIGFLPDEIEQYGNYKAKLPLDIILKKSKKKNSKLILVTAINPTPAGEGKTTTSVGLADGLNLIGKDTIVCLREPSLGPCFGIKGGAAGGGYAQVVPMEDINLHFTGDFHAIGLANNLLAALIDNHLQQGNQLNIDPRRITWKRVMDMNDRALRNVNIGLGGVMNGVPRESGFDITVASEVMAIFCLSLSLKELKERLGRIVIGLNYNREPVTAKELKAEGAMATLLKDAFKPNLVQTLEGTPAIIHGGPFANIAHGCNSVIATKSALGMADYVVTEAGFGADLGAEKFFNIKCRKSGLRADAVVLVATVRALKMQGGMAKDNLLVEDLDVLNKGLDNLKKHIENLRSFGVPVVVAINNFKTDTNKEIELIKANCGHLGVPIVLSEVWAKGGKGAEALAKKVVSTIEKVKPCFSLTYKDDETLWNKVKIISKEIYGAEDINADTKIRNKFKQLESQGFGKYPVCMAKTQYSFSTDPLLLGRPKNFMVPISDVYVAAGAEFVTVITGNVMTMPGLPKVPSAEKIDVDKNGVISGLF